MLNLWKRASHDFVVLPTKFNVKRLKSFHACHSLTPPHPTEGPVHRLSTTNC